MTREETIEQLEAQLVNATSTHEVALIEKKLNVLHDLEQREKKL